MGWSGGIARRGSPRNTFTKLLHRDGNLFRMSFPSECRIAITTCSSAALPCTLTYSRNRNADAPAPA